MESMDASETEVYLLYKGGEVADELRSRLTHVRVAPHVKEIPNGAFRGCIDLVVVKLNEGLQVIGDAAFAECIVLQRVAIPSTITEWGHCAFSSCRSLTNVQLCEGLKVIGKHAFEYCASLRSVTLPSTVIKLSYGAFFGCSGLIELKLNEGLQHIGADAFFLCVALQSVTIPSTVNKLDRGAFVDCMDLSEVILSGERFLNHEFLASGIFNKEQGLLNEGAIDKMLFDEDGDFAFDGTNVKISIPWALSERLARLPHECRVSVDERIRNFRRLELTEEGNVLARFPDVSMASDDEAEYGSDSDTEGYGSDSDTEWSSYTEAECEDPEKVQDINLKTARSLYQVLQSIAYHELKEASILIELAAWKSSIDGAASVPRAGYRVPIPDTAKILIIGYCGFAGFLKPAIEGA